MELIQFHYAMQDKKIYFEDEGCNNVKGSGKEEVGTSITVKVNFNHKINKLQK